MEKEESKYWDLDSLHMEDMVFEDFYKDFCNDGKKRILTVRSKTKYPKYEVGNEYWIDLGGMMSATNYVKCKITYLRNGVVFFIEDGKDEEDHFEEFSIMHAFSEPLEISVNLDPNYYEIVGSSGKMKVNYLINNRVKCTITEEKFTNLPDMTDEQKDLFVKSLNEQVSKPEIMSEIKDIVENINKNKKLCLK